MTRSPRVSATRVTPIAIKDPPLLNMVGVHQPFALRVIIEVTTDAGLVGLGEAYGNADTVVLLEQVAPELAGLSIFDLNEMTRRLLAAVRRQTAKPSSDLSLAQTRALVVSLFEVAMFDLQGKATGLRVCDLLGGAVRTEVPFSAYLFYRWAEHPADPGYPPDGWGEALDPAGIVTQAGRMIDEYGFTSLKLKGGVFPPDEEVEAIRALKAAYPGHPLRIDPNENWSVATSLRVAHELEGDLEYLEDPVRGIAGMAEVAAGTTIPLATNACVTMFEDFPEAVRARPVQVVLADHHFWGGLRACLNLARICETFGFSLSMHSNSHLGISLAAMTHLAAATPSLTYACDTHRPWQCEDVIQPGALEFRNGSVRVPDGPGLGVTLDHEALAALHEQYLRCGIRYRDDIAAMRVARPDWTGRTPRF